MGSPVFLLGLDGASWELVDRHLAGAKLPNLRTLQDEGVRADLTANLPPVTCPSWRCLSSGKTPGQLGVYWWEQIDVDLGTIDISNASDFKCADIWEYTTDEGINTGVVNMPLTFPPSGSIHPFVAGGPDCESKNYTSSLELESELRERLDYRVHTETAPTDSSEQITDDILDLIDLRFETAKYLYEEYDLTFLMTIIYYLVRLEHYYWDDKSVRKAWELIDDHIEWFIEQDFTIFVVSDHGCAEIDTIFNINECLRELGYLYERGGISLNSVAPKVNRERIASILGALGIRRMVTGLLPKEVKSMIPASPGGVQGRRKQNVINWEDTEAVASGQGPVYAKSGVNLDILIDELESVLGPNGKPVFDTVHRTTELYPTSDEDPNSPDLIAEQRKGVHTTDSIGSGNLFELPAERGKWRAENHKTGLFTAYGADISSSWKTDQVDICQVMPTILATLGVDIPNDISQGPLPLFTESPNLEYREPLTKREQHSNNESDNMEERLRDLGYLN